MPDKEKLTGTISMTMKANMGNYESADIFISIGGVTTETYEKYKELKAK